MQDNIDLKIQRLDPKSKSPTIDINTKIISIYSNQNEIIKPLDRKTIETGFRVKVPEGYLLIIMSDNILSSNNGIMATNQQIDPTNNKEIKITLFNSSSGNYMVKNGDIICSALLIKTHCQGLSVVRNINYDEE